MHKLAIEIGAHSGGGSALCIDDMFDPQGNCRPLVEPSVREVCRYKVGGQIGDNPDQRIERFRFCIEARHVRRFDIPDPFRVIVTDCDREMRAWTMTRAAMTVQFSLGT